MRRNKSRFFHNAVIVYILVCFSVPLVQRYLGFSISGLVVRLDPALTPKYLWKVVSIHRGSRFCQISQWRTFRPTWPCFLFPTHMERHRHTWRTNQTQIHKEASLWSRVRDSITRYVGRSVGRWLLAFSAFMGGFCITAPAQTFR